MILIREALKKVNSFIPEIGKVSEVIQSAVDAANPSLAVAHHLSCDGNQLKIGKEEYTLTPGGKLILIALGKAAIAMTTAVMERAGEKVSGGVCVCKHPPDGFQDWKQVRVVRGNHPIPDRDSLKAGKAIAKAVSGLTGDDLVLLLLSGGGSSLATLPVKGVDLADITILTNTLLRSGANITEVNAVRKHLDRLKGGGLLQLAAPARIAALVLSDVIGDSLDVIASGPAVADKSTFMDACNIVSRTGRSGPIPANIIQYLEKGASGRIPETIKPGDPETFMSTHTIIGSNRVSLTAAANKAQEVGFIVDIVTDDLKGEARAAGEFLAKRVHDSKGVLICGGETTVTVTGTGRGGRNLEMALGAVRAMSDNPGAILITLATDGEDGPTDAAGAVVTSDTLGRGLALGMVPDEFLTNNDSYSYFARLGDLIITGPTGTNVNDLSFHFKF